MAKTLLQSVNEVLKRVGTISGASGELTSITDSARQRHIDVAVQVINEGIEELYSATGKALPNEQAESTITLITTQQAYSLATDLVLLRWPMIDKTNVQTFVQAIGGYNGMIARDPEQNDTGLAMTAAIRPTDGKLWLDRAPTTLENGNIYTYQYDKDVSLSVAADEVPFVDAVHRAMVPAWAELWKAEMRREFNEKAMQRAQGRAARLLSRNQPRSTWSPR